MFEVVSLFISVFTKIIQFWEGRGWWVLSNPRRFFGTGTNNLMTYKRQRWLVSDCLLRGYCDGSTSLINPTFKSSV